MASAGCTDDRLVFVERRIQDDGHARLRVETGDQCMVQRISPSRHGLQTTTSIHVRNRGNLAVRSGRIGRPFP